MSNFSSFLGFTDSDRGLNSKNANTEIATKTETLIPAIMAVSECESEEDSDTDWDSSSGFFYFKGKYCSF